MIHANEPTSNSTDRPSIWSSAAQRASEDPMMQQVPACAFAPRMSEEFDINQFLCFSTDDNQNNDPIAVPDMLGKELIEAKHRALEEAQHGYQMHLKQQQEQAYAQQEPSQLDFHQYTILNMLRQQQHQQQLHAQNIHQQLLQNPIYQPCLPWAVPDSNGQQQHFFFAPPAPINTQNLSVAQKGMLGLPVTVQNDFQTTDSIYNPTPLSSLSNLTGMAMQPQLVLPPNFYNQFTSQGVDGNAPLLTIQSSYPPVQVKNAPQYAPFMSSSLPNTPNASSPPIQQSRRNSLSSIPFPSLQTAGTIVPHTHRKTKSESSVFGVNYPSIEDFVMRENDGETSEEESDEARTPTQPYGQSGMTMQNGIMASIKEIIGDNAVAGMFGGSMPVITTISGNHMSVCKIPDCLVCNRPLPDILRVSAPSWSAILRVVFFTLKISFPEKEFFNLRNHVYDFVDTHWQKICIGKTKSEHWRKQLQDTLAHNKKLFVSGADIFKQKGFWKLDEMNDPWEERSATTLLAEKHEREARYKERATKRPRLNPMGSAAM